MRCITHFSIFLAFFSLTSFSGSSFAQSDSITNRLNLMTTNASNFSGVSDVSFSRASVYPYMMQWVWVFSINRELARDIRGSNFKRWLRNISTLPEIRDGDNWKTNFIGHPFIGANVYHFYKTQGFSKKQSIIGTIIQSTLFEYTVEAWKQPPSALDLVVTPVLGSLLGAKLGDKTFPIGSVYSVARFIHSLF